MSNSQQPPPARDLEETRDELTQASIALNTAYDRLQDLRSSLQTFNARRDGLSGMRPRTLTRPSSNDPMGPNHSAIVLSDSDEESEIDYEFLRDSLPARLAELTSRWGYPHGRSNTNTRHTTSDESRTDSPSALATTPASEEPSMTQVPPRRRRQAAPAASTSRDGGITPPGSASPARRSILEAHLRQLRHASNPSEPTTTLGRRVAQRAAAAATQGASSTEHHPSGAGTVAPSDTIIHSTLPLGLEPRSTAANFNYASPHGIESRAAAHLRHSLLPVPPSGVRSPSRTRISAGGGVYYRFGDREEHRPRTARSNSLNALTRPSTTSVVEPGNTLDVSAQTPLSLRLGQIRANISPMSDEEPARVSGTPAPVTPRDREAVPRTSFGDPVSASYRVRRRVNARGEEQVFNINWSELMSEGERDEDLSDPAAWMRPPRQITRTRPDRSLAAPDPETDDTVVHEPTPVSSRENRAVGRDGGVQRRRGWARLDADGDEISTEDEAILERARRDSQLPRTRNWARGGSAWAAGRGSTVAVLDFVHHNSRDATTGHRDPISPLDESTADTSSTVRQGTTTHSRRILDDLFRPSLAESYVSPLPVTPQDKGAQWHVKEVQVVVNEQMAGR